MMKSRELPRGRVFERAMFTQRLKKFSAFCETQRFISWLFRHTGLCPVQDECGRHPDTLLPRFISALRSCLRWDIADGMSVLARFLPILTRSS